MNARRSWVIAAFVAVYLIWGSTYVGIRFAIETIPPFLLSCVRFTLAGAILLVIAKVRNAPNPTAPQFRTAAIVGSLLMLANSLVGVAESRIPSGIAALLVAMTPLFMVILEWARPHGKKPTLLVAIGLLIGLGGVVALVGPGSFGGGGGIDLIGAGTVVAGCLAWSSGSIYSRYAPRPSSGLVMTGYQMLVGGVFVGIIGVIRGEFATFHLADVSMRSILAWAYLLVFGSLIAFTAFVYLLRVSTPARVATYAYVNPVVAVILGWLLAGEAISSRMIVSAVIIVAGVALITFAEGRTAAPAKDERVKRVRADGTPYSVPDSVLTPADDVPATDRA